MTETTTHLSQVIQQGWADHADDAAGVFERLAPALELVQAPEDLPGLAALITHVAGEHLGRWGEGLTLLEQLAAHPACDLASDPGRAVLRSQAVLQLGAGELAAAEELLTRAHAGSPLPEASTRARVLAVTASALAGQGRAGEAGRAFDEALGLLSYGPGKDDPAARALAITGNNLACELEERAERSPEEDALLERAALAARTWWEVAGSWNNVQIAEYRLAMTYLALGRPTSAAEHAAKCLELCRANAAGPGDLLFAHEVNARAAHAKGDQEAAQRERDLAHAALAEVGEGLRSYAEQTLNKLDAALAD
ncbi:MAG TPA: hypothetical protein DEA08_30885 [Planctomycetes bacterium]|nr:hypothetical protein [Planctomycetota bacterium]